MYNLIRKELTLRELQNESLEILKDVHSFCVANNIIYSVAYGTLIGTIRHKGFIPWDDDIDIIMPRAEYERFCQIFCSEHYKLTCRSQYDNCLLAFARVYDDKRTQCDAVAPWICKDAGVFIDVFPIDYVSDDEKKFKQQYKILQKYWKNSATARAALGRFRKDKPWKFNAKLIVKKLLYPGSYFAKRYIDKQMHLLEIYTETKTNHWSQLGCLDSYEYHNSSDFTSTLLLPFEDMEVMVLNGYDRVLTECFGNYMELPPVEKRKGHCDGMTMFYWNEGINVNEICHERR